MKKLMFMAVIAMVLTVFNACQKDELKTSPDEAIAKTGNPDVYLENDYLAFKNMNAVDSVMNVLNSMSRQEKEAWDQNMGLKSARAEFDKLYDEYEKLTSKEEFLKFKSKYAGQLKFNEMDETDCSIDYPYIETSFTPILNNHGVFKVGLSILCYTNESQIIILDGDLNKLNNLNAYIDDKNVLITRQLKSTTESQNTLISDFGSYNPFPGQSGQRWWTSGDRRLLNELRYEKWAIWVSEDSFNYIYNVGHKYYMRQLGQKKTWLGWNNYNTIYEINSPRRKVENNPTVNVPLNIDISPEVYGEYPWILFSDERLVYISKFNYSGPSAIEYISQIPFSFDSYVTFRGFNGTLYYLKYNDAAHPVFP